MFVVRAASHTFQENVREMFFFCTIKYEDLEGRPRLNSTNLSRKLTPLG